MALRYTISKNGLQLLLQSLGLRSSEFRGSDEIVFVAIDFEHLSNLQQDLNQNLNSQVGISILDTKDLISSPPQDIISTYNLVTGSPSYCATAKKKFLFGETITIHQRDILFNLESFVPRTRNIVLVGHDIANDPKVLQLLHFDRHTSIVGILDTGKIVSAVLTLPNVLSTLSRILSELQCPFQNLHVAGNDAYFTLRVFLLLAIRSYRDEVVDSRHQEILAALKAITNVPIPSWGSESHPSPQTLPPQARYPGSSGVGGELLNHEGIPRRSDPQARNIKKRRRLEKSRKHQSKSWDIEKQEQIRAEREQRTRDQYKLEGIPTGYFRCPVRHSQETSNSLCATIATFASPNSPDSPYNHVPSSKAFQDFQSIDALFAIDVDLQS